MTTFGVHTGLQNTTIAELRDLWTRIEDLGFDWISIWDHFYSADFNGYECHEAVACHAALACHTSRVRVGLARLLRRLPAPRRAGQRHHHDRPPLGRPGRPRPRRRLGVQRVRRLRHPVPVGGRAPRPARGVDPGDPRAAARGGHRLRRQARHPHRGALRAEARAGRAADLGGRQRREAHAAHRRPLRRRLERAVRVAGDRGPQAQRARRPLRHRRPRPGRDPHRGERRACAPTTTRCRRSSAASPRASAPAC